MNEVFGVQRDLPLNYVERRDVDNKLRNALSDRNHIVIYGSSKQGKSSLRKWALQDQQQILVSCISIRNLAQLHLAILKEAGYTVNEYSDKMASASKVSISVGVDFPGGIKPTAGGEYSYASDVSVSKKTLELDPTDINEVVSALENLRFTGLIVLEDYHYLPEGVQGDFARLLKAYYEYSRYCFVIIGVWLDEHRLIRFAGDLRERLASISADRWSTRELAEVIEKGEMILGIEFSGDFKEHLLSQCFGSVWVVQQICKQACTIRQVTGNTAPGTVIGDRALAEELISDLIRSQSARSQAFIDGFSSGPVASSDGTPARIFQWITFTILASDTKDLARGLQLSEIKDFTDRYYSTFGYIDGTLLRLNLEQAAWFQMAGLKITPIVVDYDQTARRLTVVDREFLMWLNAQNRVLLLRDAGMPLDALRSLIADGTSGLGRHSRR